MTNFFNLVKQNLPLEEAIIISVFLGLISTYFLKKIIKKYIHSPHLTPLTVTISAFTRALYIIFPLIYFSFSTSLLNLSNISHDIEILIKILTTLALSVAAIKMLDYIDIWIERKKNTQQSSSLRTLITRGYLLKKLLTTLIVLLGIALVLLNFPALKELGKGILISASVLGGILAFAAQKIFSNIFSGIDFILNRPISIGDLITIDTELGTIEKITLNQIHLRTWDLRLIIYPLTYFITNPFQNLSHNEQGFLGTILLYVDYKVNIEKIRQLLTEILNNSPCWDKKSNTLQMIECNENAVQLRAVVSAKNAGDLWNLRCYVREQLIKSIYLNYPEMLPKKYIELNDRLGSAKKTAVAESVLD